MLVTCLQKIDVSFETMEHQLIMWKLDFVSDCVNIYFFISDISNSRPVQHIKHDKQKWEDNSSFPL